MLGVPIGEVQSVRPDGEKVHVKMRVKRGLKLPADVRAVQVSPSIVADRFIQLTRPTPVVAGAAQHHAGHRPDDGPRRGRRALRQPPEAVPFARPRRCQRQARHQGGRRHQFVRVGADNLRGNGEARLGLHEPVEGCDDAVGLSGNIVDTIKQLNTFVAALDENDAQVRQFNTQMASFNSFLAGERQRLGQALATLSVALGDVARFVNDNQQAIGDTVRSLQPTAKLLNDNQDSIKEILTVLPVTVSNLINAYDAESGTLAMRLTIQDLQNLLATQCKLLNPGNLMPGTQPFLEWQHKMAPIISHCTDIANQVVAGTSPAPVLPFGIMSNDKTQRYVVPGTRPGRKDPGLMLPTPTSPNPQTPKPAKPTPTKPKPRQSERGPADALDQSSHRRDYRRDQRWPPVGVQRPAVGAAPGRGERRR